MIDGLSLALSVVCLIAALTAAVGAATRRYRRANYDPTLVILQVALMVQAMLDVVAWVRGHRPGEPATHAAYVVASLVVLPLAAVETKFDDGGWSAGLLIVAFVVLAVLVLRMQTTWRSA